MVCSEAQMTMMSGAGTNAKVVCRDVLGWLYRRVIYDTSPALANAIYNRLPPRALNFALCHGVLRPGRRSCDWMVSLPQGRRFHVPLNAGDRFAASCAFEYKAHDPGLKRMQQFLIDRRKARSLYVDIGANIGVSSIYALASGCPAWLFEPNGDLHEFGRRFFAYNHFSGARWLQTALSDRPGQASFFVSQSTFLSSFNQSHARQEGDAREIVVEMRTLDSFLPEIRAEADEIIIKIDVEGYEAAVLQGADKVTEQMRPPVLIELLPDAEARGLVWDYFHRRDYVCRGIYESDPRLPEVLPCQDALAEFDGINFVFVARKGDADRALSGA